MNPTTSITMPARTTSSTSGTFPHGAGGRSSRPAARRRRAGRDGCLSAAASVAALSAGFGSGLRGRRFRLLLELT
jgi:hypothetical protein